MDSFVSSVIIKQARRVLALGSCIRNLGKKTYPCVVTERSTTTRHRLISTGSRPSVHGLKQEPLHMSSKPMWSVKRFSRLSHPSQKWKRYQTVHSKKSSSRCFSPSG